MLKRIVSLLSEASLPAACAASVLLCGASAAAGAVAAAPGAGGGGGGGTPGKGPQKGKIPGGNPGNMPGTTVEEQKRCSVTHEWKSFPVAL